MESLPFTDETSEEFAKRRKCQTTPVVDAEVSSLAISPVVPPEQAVPLAVKTPDGEYIYVSQETREDVAIIGSKTLSQKCSDLSNESDKMYNWSFGSAQHAAGSSSGKMAMYRPRRFVCPSKYVHDRIKVSVSTKEREDNRILIDLSNCNYNKKDIIAYKNVRVKFGSLGSSLRLGGKVETYVLNALCKKIFDKTHAKRSLKHFFFTPISDFLLNNYDFKNEEERNKRFLKAVHSFKGANAASLPYNSELLFFPIFFENHWCVIVALIKEWVWAVLEPCLRDFGPDLLSIDMLKLFLKKIS
ncbi:hypothetical protein QOZ80_2BG0180800 [Eleusine coracana subsp. coracana]|nr:hypothetical protein QOZ80_2BG0180800 [Eleusine coracana subsp. coracana]